MFFGLGLLTFCIAVILDYKIGKSVADIPIAFLGGGGIAMMLISILVYLIGVLP